MDTYIDGIYNYCDRWCEKCQFTSKCRTFALEKKLEEAELVGGLQKEEFWEMFESVFDEQNGINTDIEINSLFEIGSEDSLEDNDQYLEVNENKSEDSVLFQTARSYSADVNQWIEQYEQQLQNIYRDTSTSTQIENALEIILRYAFFIPVKLARAVDGQDEECEVLPDNSDANGSAKVAIIAINRSIGAWSIIRSEFKQDQDMTAKFIGILISLRRVTEENFPKAMNFIRPGFDE